MPSIENILATENSTCAGDAVNKVFSSVAGRTKGITINNAGSIDIWFDIVAKGASAPSITSTAKFGRIIAGQTVQLNVDLQAVDVYLKNNSGSATTCAYCARIIDGDVGGSLSPFDGTLSNFTSSDVAGVAHGLEFQTSGSTRWKVVKGAQAESGGNAGSDFEIQYYSDAGAYIGTLVTGTRTGQLRVAGTLKPYMIDQFGLYNYQDIFTTEGWGSGIKIASASCIRLGSAVISGRGFAWASSSGSFYGLSSTSDDSSGSAHYFMIMQGTTLVSWWLTRTCFNVSDNGVDTVQVGGAVSATSYKRAGVAWNRAFVATFNDPAGAGEDKAQLFIVPYESDGVTSKTWNVRAVRVYADTAGAGASTFNIKKYTGTGALSGTNLMTSALSLAGGSHAASFTGTFATTQLTSGDKVWVDYATLDGSVDNVVVQLHLEEV